MQSLQPAGGYKSERKEKKIPLLLALFKELTGEVYWAFLGRGYKSYCRSLQSVECIIQTDCMNVYKSPGLFLDIIHHQSLHAV